MNYVVMYFVSVSLLKIDGFGSGKDLKSLKTHFYFSIAFSRFIIELRASIRF